MNVSCVKVEKRKSGRNEASNHQTKTNQAFVAGVPFEKFKRFIFEILMLFVAVSPDVCIVNVYYCADSFNEV